MPLTSPDPLVFLLQFHCDVMVRVSGVAMLLCMLNTQHCMNAVTCGLQDMHGGKHVQERKQEVASLSIR